MRLVPRLGAMLLVLVAAPAGAASGRAHAPKAAPAMPVVTDADRLASTWQGPGTTVVHFWASWCGTCTAELPRLAKALERAEDRGARVVLVSLDDAEQAEAARALLRRRHVPGARLRLNVADPHDVTSRIDPAWDAAIPATFVFRDGVRTASFLGALSPPSVLDEALNR